MKEMLEAAKFYKECIKEIRESIMLEIQQDDNSVVILHAKLFSNPAFVGDQLHTSFTINGQQFDTVIPISRTVNAGDAIRECKKCVVEKISTYISTKILDKWLDE